MLPKSEWWAVIAAYNDRIYPLQWVGLGVIVIMTLYLIFGESRIANRIIKTVLGFMNLWIAVAFFFSSDGFSLPMRFSQGMLFIVIGFLLILDLWREKYEFRFPEEGWQKIFFIVGMLLMLVYPFIGAIQGKPIAHWIVQGTLPCPTTAYTLILIITALKREGRLLYSLLLLWAIPFPPLIQIPMYGVYEDGFMFAVGVFGLVLLIIDLQKQRINKKTSPVMK